MNAFCILAPMDDVTDVAFRRLISETYPPDEMFTEFVSVDGLQSAGRDNTKHKLLPQPGTVPLIAQIWGIDPENYERTASELADSGDYAGIDINMGCPTNVVTRKGACSAFIKTPEKAAEIIAATKAGAGKIPVSVKTRLGWSQIETEEWCGFLLKQEINRLIIHGRTRKEMSKVPTHWDEIGKVVELRDEIAPEIKIIGNGDIANRYEAEQTQEKYKLDGVMIGRGIFANPACFAQDHTILSQKEKLIMYRTHVQYFSEYFGETKNPAGLKKFAKMYVRDSDGASEVRQELMNTSTLQELETIISQHIALL
ncbi:tRNA-dihydrouridine synthase [Candidatus Saccharibacteria bacterium]|nr:tRNA-dihydrouridine synthase [Candidatus Saccharibacteria bacterium]